ncbi:MAG: hypothetical protein HQL52_13390 [Magnetococcales bacterium]|nr:hypothetical protein [Magnetococcales bacterium]
MLKSLLLLILFRPNDLFVRMRARSFLIWALVLQIFRWEGTALTTVVNLYRYDAPMFLPVPFGIDPSLYRYVEIYAYGPFGLLIISVIAYFIYIHGAPHATIGPVTYAKCWELVGLTFFGPWLPSLFIDSVLVYLGWGGPEVIIPWHVAIVGIEAVLTMVGLHAVFGIRWRKAFRLGGMAGMIFLVLAGLVIR